MIKLLITGLIILFLCGCDMQQYDNCQVKKEYDACMELAKDKPLVEEWPESCLSAAQRLSYKSRSKIKEECRSH